MVLAALIGLPKDTKGPKNIGEMLVSLVSKQNSHWQPQGYDFQSLAAAYTWMCFSLYFRSGEVTCCFHGSS